MTGQLQAMPTRQEMLWNIPGGSAFQLGLVSEACGDMVLHNLGPTRNTGGDPDPVRL